MPAVLPVIMYRRPSASIGTTNGAISSGGCTQEYPTNVLGDALVRVFGRHVGSQVV